MLKEAIAKGLPIRLLLLFTMSNVLLFAENWESKGKFPPNIKPVLAKVALRAVVLGEYDDNFFNLMPRLFPYNKFTMTVCFEHHHVFSLYVDHKVLCLEINKANNMAGPYESAS